MTTTYSLDLDELTVLAREGAEVWDLNAEGETCQYPWQLRDFVIELCAQGCFSPEIRDDLVEQIDSL